MSLPTFIPKTETTEQEERKPEGLLAKTVDILNRPLFASANFSKSMVEGKSFEESLKSAGKGLTGQERNYYSDVLNSTGVKNKYVRSIAGFALDVALDPTTYLTFGTGKGVKLGLSTLNESGKVLLNETMKRELPKLTALNLEKSASKEVAERMARETLEEAVLRTSLKEPEKYISQKAVRFFGQEVPVLTDFYRVASKTKAGKVAGNVQEKMTANKVSKWFGERFIGDEYIIKHAKDIDETTKSVLALQNRQVKERIFAGREEALQTAIKMVKDVPDVKDRELIANAIEKSGVKVKGVKPKLENLLPSNLVEKAKNVQRWAIKEITEPEARAGFFKSYKETKSQEEFFKTLEGYIPHYYPKERGLASVFSKDLPQPIIARSKSGRQRIFQTMEEAIKAGWQPIEDYALSFGIRNAYSKRLLAVDDYVQKTLSAIGKPLSKTSEEWKSMVKNKKVPEGMGMYIPRGGARFYPLYNSAKDKTIQIKNSKAIKELFGSDEMTSFSDELLKEAKLTPLQNAFNISDDIPVYLLPKDMADMMNKISPFTRQEGLEGFLKVSNAVMNMWKNQLTVIWPAFHARNAMSNLWLAFMGGLNNPQRFYDALRLQRYDYAVSKGKDVADFTLNVGNKSYKASELVRMGRQTGVISRGWFGSELQDSIERQMMALGAKPKILDRKSKILSGVEKVAKTPFSVGRKAGTAVENNARVALFLDQLGKGVDVNLAARHTKKFLFDYTELTDFEKKYMKQVAPFYTWLRKNIPLEVEQLMKQPGKFAMIGKAKGEVEKLSPQPDEEYMPSWMSGRELFVRLPWQDKNDNPLYIPFDLAFQDLAKLNITDYDTFREWFSQVRPEIQVLQQVLSNQNLYLGRNIIDPDLPDGIKFRELIKESLLNNLRFRGYVKKFSREDISSIVKIIDATLGLKAYPYDEMKEKKFYYDQQAKEQRALRKRELK